MHEHRSATPFIIAIDGPNASGKGTLARNLGKELGFPVLDTGLLYRAVAWLVKKRGHAIEDQEKALEAANALQDLLGLDFLDNDELRSLEAGQMASIVSAYPPVRQSLFDLQRNFALNPVNGAAGTILDGRDIGTIICPDASIKFFVTASPEIRAARRARELHGEKWEDHHADVLQQTLERDKRDMERPVAPLRPAEDAMMLDTSEATADQVMTQALEAVQSRMKTVK